MMRLLTEDFFARSPALLYPILAMFIFMGVFLVASLRSLLARKEQFDAVANLPFDDSLTELSGGSTGRVASSLGGALSAEQGVES